MQFCLNFFLSSDKNSHAFIIFLDIYLTILLKIPDKPTRMDQSDVTSQLYTLEDKRRFKNFGLWDILLSLVVHLS